MGLPQPSAWPIQVFAVDDCSVQLTWPASPAEDLRVEVGAVVAHPEPSPTVEVVLDARGVTAPATSPSEEGRAERWAHQYWAGRRRLDSRWPAGPGAVVLEGLAPGTTYDVVASARGVPSFLAGRARTLVPPGGAVLCKFATISDLHIGEKNFGVRGRIHDAEEAPPCSRDGDKTTEPYPVRALRAAIDEATAWGAQRLVVKGDLSNWTTPAEVRDVGTILAASPIPVEAVLGNHDNQFGVDARAVLEAQGVLVSWRPTRRRPARSTARAGQYGQREPAPSSGRAACQGQPMGSSAGRRGPRSLGRAPPPSGPAPVPDRLPAGVAVRRGPAADGGAGGGEPCHVRQLRAPAPEPPLPIRAHRDHRGRLDEGLPRSVGGLQGLPVRAGPGGPEDVAERRHNLDRDNPPRHERPVAPVVPGAARRQVPQGAVAGKMTG